MTLSNCQSCKYLDRRPNHLNDIVCGLNPAYANAWKRLNSLDEYTLKCVPIDRCPEFDLDPSLEEKEITLSLTFSEWQRLAHESQNSSISQALNNVPIQVSLSLTVGEWQAIINHNSNLNVYIALAESGIEPHQDSWIDIDSSCIAAVAYLKSESILKIRFNEGYIYQYDDVHQKYYSS